MIKIDRMDLADCGSPEALIATILKHVPDLPIPVPVDEFALAVGIERIEPLKTGGFEGALIAREDKSRGVILVNRNRSRQRQRFSAGHELGHFLIPTHQALDPRGFMCSSQDMQRSSANRGDRLAQMEVEANRFSAHLLMPPPIIRKFLGRLRGADLQHILDLASKFDVSKEAAARRYAEYHGEACAVIVSKDDRVARIHRGADFPFVAVKAGEPLPRESLTANYRGPEPISHWDEQDPANWLGDQRSKRLSELLEQVLLQSEGYKLTLLHAEMQDEEDSEEDERMSSSWRPAFRRWTGSAACCVPHPPQNGLSFFLND